MDELSTLKESATTLLEAGNYSEATLQFLKITRLDSRNDWAWQCLGAANFGTRHYGLAVEAFNKAIKLNPKNATAWKYRGLSKRENRDFEGAIKDFNKFLSEFDPQCVEIWQARAGSKGALPDEKNKMAAILDYDEALRLSPDNALLFYLRGFLKLRLRYYEDAVPDLKRAVELNTVRELRGQYQQDLNQALNCVQSKNARRMKKVDPVPPKAVRASVSLVSFSHEIGLAKSCAERGEYTEAICRCEEMLRKNVNIPEEKAFILLLMGSSYYQLKDSKEAYEHYLKALKFAPGNQDILMALGKIDLDEERYKSAIRYFKKSLKQEPRNSFALMFLGQAYFRSENYKEAINYLNKANDLDPKMSLVWVFLGFAKFFAQSYDANEILQNLSEGIRLGTPSVDVYVIRAQIYIKLERFEEAAQDLSKALELRPGDPDLMKKLEIVINARSGLQPSPSAPPPGTQTLQNIRAPRVTESSRPSAPVMGEQTLQLMTQKNRSPEINSSEIQFEHIIGRGGAGVVYRGLWNQGVVAVKTSNGFEHMDIMQKECAVLGALRHPNIVNILGYSVGKAGEFCLVMEFYPNGSLNQYVYSPEVWNNPLSWRLRCALEVSQGLAFLHEQNLLHLDLKPENVLVCADWRVVITDFGISRKLATNQTHQTTMSAMGTVSFTAPEIFQPANNDGKTRYDKANDVYSFAMLLLCIVAQKMPYEGWDAMRIITAVISKKREEIPKETPKKLAALIKSCWSYAPASRPTAAKVVAGLTDIYAKEPRDPRNTFPSRK